MEYVDEVDPDEAKAKRRRLVFQLLTGVLVLALGIGLIYLYDRTLGLTSEERFEKELAGKPIYRIALEPLRQKYPYEFRKLRQAAVESYNLEKEGGVLAHLPPGALHAFMKRHAVEALQGSDKDAFAFIDAYAALSDRAVKDKALCNALMGYEEQYRDTLLMLSQEPVSKMFASFIALAASGRDKPVVRTEASRSELLAFYRQIFELGRKYPMGARNDVDGRCKREAGLANAIRQLPPERRSMFVSIVLQGMR